MIFISSKKFDFVKNDHDSTIEKPSSERSAAKNQKNHLHESGRFSDDEKMQQNIPKYKKASKSNDKAGFQRKRERA